MKRLLLLLTLTAFLLAGCQSVTEPGASDQSTADATTAISIEQQLGVIDTTPKTPSHITFVINPSWDIYFDEVGLILELVPLNEDAQDLLQDTDLTGMDLNDGLPILLDQAQSKGYLESGDTIHFELHFQEANSQQMMLQTIQTYELIQNYLDTSDLENINLNGAWAEAPTTEQEPAAEGGASEEIVSSSSAPAETSPAENDVVLESPSPSHNDYPIFLVEECDANGYITYEKLLPYAGCVKEIFYHQDNTETEIWYQDGCTTTTHCKNGIPVDAFTLCPDGSYYTQEYYPNGLVKSIQRHNVDGKVTTSHFYSDGSTASLRIDYPDGNYELTTYAEDGLSHAFCDGLGNQSYSTYHENGNVASMENYSADGSIHILTYDSEGRETYQYWINELGESAEYLYNDDFSYTVTWYKSNGEIRIRDHVSADGKLLGGIDTFGRSYTINSVGIAIYDE